MTGVGDYRNAEDLPRIPRISIDYGTSKVFPYSLGEPRGWAVGHKDSNLICFPDSIDSPRGPFRCDGTSIPRALRWLISKDDPELLYASINHDWLYRYGILWVIDKKRGAPSVIFITQAQADEIMTEILEAYNAARWKRNLIKPGLKSFGWIGWNNERNVRSRKTFAAAVASGSINRPSFEELRAR